VRIQQDGGGSGIAAVFDGDQVADAVYRAGSAPFLGEGFQQRADALFIAGYPARGGQLF
jgi:hypothetical protein